MKKLSTKKFKSIFRSCCIVGLAFLFAVNPMVTSFIYAEDVNANALGMQWTRVKSEAEMLFAFRNLAKDNNINNDYGWVPILICWQDGNKSYYMSSNHRDGDDYDGTQATSTSGVKVGEDSFKTRSNLNSLLCKWKAGEIKDFPESIQTLADMFGLQLPSSYASDCTFSLAHRGDFDKPAKCLAINIKWYGVAWYAACRGDFRDAPRSNPSSAEDDSGAASSASIRTDWTFVEHGETFEIVWRSGKGNVCDRHWSRDGHEADLSKWSRNTHKGYYVYVGEPCAVSIQTQSSVVQPYTYTKITDYTIKSNVEVVIYEGACLVMDGTNYNCGHILVDGGTLVLRGVLDADTGGSAGSSENGKFNPSDITVKNGGKLIVERNGVLLHRNTSSGVYIEDGSSLFVEGTMVVASNFTIGKNATVRALPGSFIGLGIMPTSVAGAAEFNPDGIASNKSSSLSGVADVVSNAPNFKLGDNSSFVSDGAVFMVGHTNSTIGNNASRDWVVSSNVYSSLESMMRKW